MATFEVHRNILAARCSYFLAAFANPTDDTKARKTEIVDSSKEAVEMLLIYIYSAQLPKEIEVKICHFLLNLSRCFVIKRICKISLPRFNIYSIV